MRKAALDFDCDFDFVINIDIDFAIDFGYRFRSLFSISWNTDTMYVDECTFESSKFAKMKK